MENFRVELKCTVRCEILSKDGTSHMNTKVTLWNVRTVKRK
jgi:hypothetical protein